jgi:hypothetical protein
MCLHVIALRAGTGEMLRFSGGLQISLKIGIALQTLKAEIKLQISSTFRGKMLTFMSNLHDIFF